VAAGCSDARLGHPRGLGPAISRRSDLDRRAGADYSLPVIGARFAQPAPDFSLPSTLGRPVSLSEYRGRGDVVLAFYCYDFGNI